ncbi:hypothetical protein LTR86_005442 [Recurvomyces mirabilis]|nr:hypothetical protein LTR86_005442 [Recurvomyces mirabilis]
MPPTVYIDRQEAARLGLDLVALESYFVKMNISTTAGTGASATASTTQSAAQHVSTTSSTLKPAFTPSEGSADVSGRARFTNCVAGNPTPSATTSSRANGVLLTPSASSTTSSSRANGVLLTPSASSVVSFNASSAASDTSSTPTLTATNTRTGTASISSVSTSFSQQDIVAFFDTQYGREEKLEAYRKLCKHLGVSTFPDSITKCKKALKQIYINIHDFLRAHQDNTPAPRFATRDALRADLRSSRDKRFPREAAKGNPFLGWMLVDVYDKQSAAPRKQVVTTSRFILPAVPAYTGTAIGSSYGGPSGPGANSWW